MQTTTHEGLTFEDPIIENEEQNKETTETKVEEVKEEPKQDDKVAKQPERFDGESDTQYSLRLQLFNAGLAKSQAETEEEKSLIAERMKDIRKQMYTRNQAPQKTNPTETTEQNNGSDELFQTEEEKKTAIENLRKLGFISQEEVERRIQEAVESINSKQEKLSHEAAIREQQQGIKDFYSQRPDIASNQESRKVLEQTVLQKFNISPETSKKELIEAMDMVANYLFPHSKRSEVAQKAQAKVDILNVDGGNFSSSKGNSIEDDTAKLLKESGWTDDDLKKFTS